MLDFDEFQLASQKNAFYPEQNTVNGLVYTALGVAGEAGEVANKVKKIIRNDAGIITAANKAAVLDECGDVLWYVAQICSELNERMSVVAEMNKIKLRDRAAKGSLKIHD